ncbi:DUF262 domain-containing protein [Demequina sp. SYSU T00192]|uniref:DUF262 domain-containing protein n=1 Tax=Demequina litoralis TaxID=3051660 RepID=A0ABT8G669_9MICO|nr:DUF262 domain-containing protein [Demequina sp. SYSU T00192]MDN4474641.1 DUF262 domain-containing protein [Demequina sp. SYSU T00192]
MTSPASQITFALEGVATVLQQNSLGVPIYQRSYSWGKDQISDYWADLQAAFLKEGTAEYFLGTVVLTSEGQDGRVSVIDGQQRLATTTILLAAIRDEYRERGDDARAGVVQTDFIARLNLGTGEATPHLTLNSDDDAYFRQVVVEEGDPDAVERTRASHRKLAHAYKTLRSRVTETANSAGANWMQHLFAWVTFLKDRVRVIRVLVPTEADAFLIFETLNDRGADLTIADLLKNYLFGRAGSRLDTVRDGWMQTLGALDLAKEESLFTAFLRHYWSSRYGATRERELYAKIKEEITGEAGAVALVAGLQKAAGFYAAILSTEDDFWTGWSSGERANVETLLRLDLEQHRPLLLAAMQHFTQTELKALLRALVSWSVRGLVVGGIGGGTTERAYCDAAVKIRSGEIKTVDETRAELASIIASDDEFRAAFANVRVPRSALARYYLAALEKDARGDAEPELVPNSDEDQVNLEHVLPKNSTRSEWPAFTDDSAKAYAFRLGNMALLQKGPNGRIGNKPWGVKRPVLATSQLSLTQGAAEHAEWDAATIESRQAEFAEAAVSIWPA